MHKHKFLLFEKESHKIASNQQNRKIVTEKYLKPVMEKCKKIEFKKKKKKSHIMKVRKFEDAQNNLQA